MDKKEHTTKEPKVQKKSNKQNEIKQPSAFKEMMMTFLGKMQHDRIFAVYVVGGLLAIVFVIVLAVFLINTKKDDKKVETQVSANTQVSENYVLKDEKLAVDQYATVNQLFTEYFKALAEGDLESIKRLKAQSSDEELVKIQKKSEYVDSYENIKVYSKSGPIANSYITFVYYDIKFKDIDTLAPGLTTIFVETKEDGTLQIRDGEIDVKITDYIKKVAATEDVVSLFQSVSAKYNEALAADEGLKVFMEGLALKLEEEVKAALQAKADADAQQEATEETPETAAESAETMTGDNLVYWVVTTDTVNVRASDSEKADKLGKVDVGTKLMIYESRENGWCKVEYNGGEGFIKSEFLKSAGTSNGVGEAAASQTNQDATEAEPANDEQADDEQVTTSGKVTLKETANVRKSASETADKLGVAYQGESFDLIQKQADGWSKIKFNGQTGYIKSEFLE